jgi:hypothetical protein
MRHATASRFSQIFAILGVLTALAAPAAAQRGGGRGADQPDPLAVHTRARIAQVLDGVEAGAEIKPAIQEARTILDEAIAYTTLDRPEPIRDAALALRMLQQLDAATSVARPPILRYLRANGPLAAALAFLVTPEDEVDRVYWRLSKIIDAYPLEAAELPALTAAICVVHEGPVNRPSGPQSNLNPIEIFNHFRAMPGAAMDYKSFPPEIMVYLVNTRATPAELEWANTHYDGRPNLGHYYAEIKYDSGFLRGQGPKKIDGKPYTLPNLLAEGGVCVDQAYFAEHIGKAVGIPSVTSVGRGGGIGHAWIGFLRRGGAKGGHRWDFSEARWGDYTDVRGTVTEPHTGRDISEAAVQLTLNMFDVDRARVEAAVALKDAVERLDKLKGQRSYPPPPPALPSAQPPEPRPATLDAQLAMLEAALSLAPGRSDIWTAIIPLAASGEMPFDQKRRWAEALLDFVEKDQHDFVLEILRPMFESEPPERQVELWQWAERQFRGRPDLLCQSMIGQAKALAAAGDRDAAFRTLEAAATRFANDTSWAIAAVVEAEKMLTEAEVEREIIPLYARIFRRIQRPKNGVGEAFLNGSTYVQVGRRYRDLLAASGNQRMADRIDAQLSSAVRKMEE